MKNMHKASSKKQSKDTFDSYYDCITTCYRLGFEDVECVTRCVKVHLQKDIK